MAEVEKSNVVGWSLVSVNLLLKDQELEQLEKFRKCTEDEFRALGFLKKHEDYTLDEAIMYVVGEVMSGRASFLDINGTAFNLK